MNFMNLGKDWGSAFFAINIFFALERFFFLTFLKNSYISKF